MNRRRRVTGAVTGAVAGGAVVAMAAAVGFSSSSASGASGTPARLAVSGGYILRPLLIDEAAAYVRITNSGGTAARLTSVTTPLAAHVTLHTTTGTTMRQVQTMTVPARGSLVLGLGADHLMLENLTRKPAVGDKVTLVLHFADATPGTVTVTVPVRPTTYQPGGLTAR